MQVRGLRLAGEAGSITLRPEVDAIGRSQMRYDRDGSGWLGTVHLFVSGQRDAWITSMTLHPAHARDLARKITQQADFAEARAKGEPGPCLCTAWSHNLYSCPNAAALDYTMCRGCWTPETGQSELDMGHGEADRV